MVNEDVRCKGLEYNLFLKQGRYLLICFRNKLYIRTTHTLPLTHQALKLAEKRLACQSEETIVPAFIFIVPAFILVVSFRASAFIVYKEYFSSLTFQRVQVP